MVWTSYDVGSAGYAEASAIADAFGKQFGTRMRIQPSGCGIGRLQPLLQGRADYAFLATEAFFLGEGAYDFAVPDWGPDPAARRGRPSGGHHADRRRRRRASPRSRTRAASASPSSRATRPSTSNARRSSPSAA